MSLGEKGRIERELLRSGEVIAGVDEVGRGCIAGPVYASAVVLCFKKLRRLPAKSRALIRDSKTLSRAQREKVQPMIERLALASAIGISGVDEIEGLGILKASFLAMRRALSALSVEPQIVLVDGKLPIPEYTGRQLTVIGGDSLCFTISAASILAKCARDHYMIEEAQRFPAYGFEDHVGYGTRGHLASIAKVGLCPLHRRNFAPVREIDLSNRAH